jgi:hypothetical protein
MRACLIAVLLFCTGIGAQVPPLPPTSSVPPSVYLINAGGPDIPLDNSNPAAPVPEYLPDQFFNGGVAWVDPTMGAGIWATLRYAPFFTYDIPVTNGFYNVKFDLLEPNKAAAGQRVFTISVNGTTSDPIDIFKITGAINTKTAIQLMAIVGNGHLRITFQASIGNAVVSAIEISPSYVFSGVEAHFVRVYMCYPPQNDSVCLIVNPTAGQ